MTEARGQHLGRIDDAHTGEGPELVGAEVEPVADEGEDEERQQAEHEHHGDGVGDVFILGPDGRGDGHTGRDPADGQAGGQTGPQGRRHAEAAGEPHQDDGGGEQKDGNDDDGFRSGLDEPGERIFAAHDHDAGLGQGGGEAQAVPEDGGHTDGIADEHAQDDGHDEIAQVEGLHEGMQGDEARRDEP